MHGMPQANPLTAPPDVRPRRDAEVRDLRWLIHGPVRRADGGVLSWHNPAHPGFVYAEAEGLLLSLHAETLARGPEDPGVRLDGRRLAHRLASGLDDAGAVVHRGVRYAFDTAIAVAALRRWRQIEPHGPAYARSAAWLRDRLAAGVGQEGAPLDGHWSRAFGPHLLKASLALPSDPLLAGLAERFVATCWDGAWFTCHARTDEVYPHAHAYALEGLLALRAAGRPVAPEVLARGTASLLRAAARMDDLSSDVLAQAARLAIATGRSPSDPDLLVTLARLESRAAADGGVRYASDSDDLNAWATVFAVQARRWARIGPSPLYLV
jgi:hypothetical protein